MSIFKIIIIVLLVSIFFSLASGLWYLWKDRGNNSTHVVTSLTWRVALSATLFILLMLGLWMGWIQPNGP